MINPEKKPSVPENIFADEPNLVVEKDTGHIGIPGSFYGERSFNGMPINIQTVEDFLKNSRDEE